MRWDALQCSKPRARDVQTDPSGRRSGWLRLRRARSVMCSEGARLRGPMPSNRLSGEGSDRCLMQTPSKCCAARVALSLPEEPKKPIHGPAPARGRGPAPARPPEPFQKDTIQTHSTDLQMADRRLQLRRYPRHDCRCRPSTSPLNPVGARAASQPEVEECGSHCKLRIFALMRTIKTILAALLIAAAAASTASCKSADMCPAFIGSAAPTAEATAQV